MLLMRTPNVLRDGGRKRATVPHIERITTGEIPPGN
jgi:hypothetical protein